MKIIEAVHNYRMASFRLAWFFMICANWALAETVTFTTNTTIAGTNLSYENNDVTVSGCVLTVAGIHTFNSLNIINNGTVTHAAGDTGGVHLIITRDVLIASGCRIDVSAMGFPRDQGPGAGGFGYWGGGGGGFGGVGGNGYDAAGGTTYGLDTQPQFLGSGGGSRTVGGLLGGAGGGRVQLIVGDSVHVDGEIRAAGGNGGGGGGGSGGSIFVTASRITGFGTIQVDGGAGNQTPEFRGGGGGGGRVRLDGSVLIPVGNIHANGGYAYQASGLDGTVRIVGAEPQALFTSNTTISRTNLDYEGLDITVSHCVLTVAGPHSLHSLTVIDTGIVTHASSDTGGVNLIIAGDVVVDSGSKISADSCGYPRMTGPGHGTGTFRGGGGGYGGRGGNGWTDGVGGPTYDSNVTPLDLGSGGGHPSYGGNGGGAIHITTSGSLYLDGLITANGQIGGGNSSGHGGGGSGGSVYITASIFSGGGTITANGGQGRSNAGSGGGGRIAIYFDSINFNGSLAVNAGPPPSGGGHAGENGTVFWGSALPSIVLTFPNGGDTLFIGQNYNVSWASENLNEEIRIEVNRDYPIGSWETLIAGTANDGSESVVVSGPASLNCRIRVSAMSFIAADTSDANFAIADGYAVAFDGSGDYIQTIGLPWNPVSNLTYEAWIKPATYNGPYPPIVSGHGCSLEFLNQTISFWVNANGTFRRSNLGAVPLGVWTHVAGSYDGNAIHLFVNGVEIGNPQAWAGSIPIADDIFVLGGYMPSGRYFNGLIEEARVWSVARTAQDIQATMAVELAGNELGLRHVWHFNEGSGTTAGDSGPFANTGTLSGNTHFVPSTVAFDTVGTLLSLVAPLGGETWIIGDTAFVRWTATHLTGNIAIELNRNWPSVTWESLAANTFNDDQFEWIVTEPLTANARMRVRSLDFPTLSDTSNADFAIGSRTLSLLTPSGGEIWYAGSTQSIIWVSQNLTENVRIELSRDFSSDAWETIIANTLNDGAHSWLVTFPASSAARVRVVGVVHTSIGDSSDSNFAIAMPSLALTAPNGGQTWYITHSDTIRWTSQNLAGNVNVELNRAFPNAGWEAIASNTANDGVHVWTVSGTSSDSARFRVTSVNVPVLSDTSDASLSIVSPSVTLIVPNTNVTWYISQPETILWVSNQLTGNVRIELKRGYPSGSWEDIAASTANDGNHVWTVSGLPNAGCRIRVSSAIASTVADTSDASFAILNPTIAITAPNGGEVWDIGDTMQVMWQAPELAGNVRIELSRSFPSGSWASIVSSAANTGSYAWRVNYPAAANARIRITSASLSSVSDTSNTDFVIPPPPPELLPSQAANPFPINNDVNVSPRPTLSWAPAPEAERYDLYLWPDAESLPSTPRSSNQTDTYYSVNPSLLAGTTHRWKVVTRNVYGETDGQEWQFTVRSLPDLQVSNISTSSAIAGQPMQVTWQIGNAELGPTNAPNWSDFVWITSDFEVRPAEPEDVLLGQFSNLYALNPGESYIQTQSVILPENYVGIYYLFVLSDMGEALTPDTIAWTATDGHGFDDLVLETIENNNFNFIQINILPSPVSDLRVDSVETSLLTPVASTAFSGDSINASWRVVNQGEVPTPISSWSDGVYLSTDSEWDASDMLLGSRTHGGALAVDSSYLASLHVRLPNAIDGEYSIVVKADRSDQVFEYIWEFNNDSYDSITVVPAPPPDLTVTTVNAPASATNRESITVQWTVLNDGAGEPFELSWSDKIYISSLDTFNLSQSALLNSLPHTAPLDPDCTYSAQMNVVIPNGVEGMRYIYVYTDGEGQVFEGNQEQNNVTRASGPLLVSVPDLAVETVIAPSGAESGDTTQTISWTVHNVGSVPLLNGSWGDRLFLTASPSFDTTSAIVKKTIARTGTIAADSSYTGQTTLIVPNGTSGNYYVHIKADYADQIYEGIADTNNTGRSGLMPISLSPWPDLRVTTIQVPETTIAGQSMIIAFTVANTRNAVTPNSSWNDRVYISADPAWNPADATILQTITHVGQLAADTVYSVTRSQTLASDLAGAYYLYVKTDADSVVYEHSDETNNVTRSSLFWVNSYPPVDLVVTGLTTPDFANSGQQFNVQWTVQNGGQASALPLFWNDALYLSADSMYAAGTDVRVASANHSGNLNVGQFYTFSREVTIPNGASGSKYFIIRTDTSNSVNESAEANNVMTRQVFVSLSPSPDLGVFSFSAPTDSVISGQNITCSWIVRNSGDASVGTNPWYDAIYLSLNPVLDITDTRLITITRNIALLPGDSIVDSREVTIPSYMSGNFYLILKTDNPNAIYEHNAEDDNIGVRPIYVRFAFLSDLIVSEVQVPESAMVGEPVLATWTLTNAGENQAVGTIRDGVYFSADTTWGLDDPLLGFSDRYIDIAPGASLTMSNTFRLDRSYRGDESGLDEEREGEGGNMLGDMPGMLPGSYHAIVRTDMRDVVRESDGSNNRSAAAVPVTVDIDILTLGMPISRTLTPLESVYLRIPIADTLAGPSLKIRTETDLQWVTNDLYVGFGTIPSPSTFDTRSEVIAAGHSEALVGYTVPGFYYILLAPTQSVEIQVVTIEANLTEFQVNDIDIHQIGQDSSVTILLSGESMNRGSVVSLRSDPTIIFAKHTNWDDPTRIFATFDLDSAVLGTYSVRIEYLNVHYFIPDDTLQSTEQMADSLMSELPNCLEVVPRFATPLEINVVAPSAVRSGRSFAFEIAVTNTSNFDAIAPLVLLSSRPDILTRLAGSDDWRKGTQRIMIVSPDMPAGLIRPGGTANLFITGQSPSANTSLQIDAVRCSESGLELDFDREISRAGLSSIDGPFNVEAEYLKNQVGNSWSNYEKMIANEASLISLQGSIEPEVQSLLFSALTRMASDSLQHFSEVSHSEPPRDKEDSYISEHRRSGLLDDECDPNSVADARWKLSRLAEVFELIETQQGGSHAASCHLRQFIGENFHCDNHYSADSDVARRVRQHLNATQSFARVHSEVKQSASAIISQGLVNTNGECPTGFSMTSAQNPPRFYPRENDNNLFVRGPFGLEIRPTSFWDLAAGFGTMGGDQQISISGITCRNSSACDGTPIVSYHGTITYVFRDIYQFIPGQGDLDDLGLRLQNCGQANVFETSITITEPVGGSTLLGQPSNVHCDSGVVADNPIEIQVLRPLDPNDIIGPAGIGDDHFVQTASILPYTINFENDPDLATAPAQSVRVTQRLDSTLDITSFRLGSFGFGNMIFEVPVNRAHFSARLDVRDSLGVYVDVVAGLNVTTGEIFWEFHSVDPLTGELPLDPFAGFLPVNDTLSHHGEGFVTYTIRPCEDAQTGERIDAEASIVFDVNEPVITPPIFNTSDAGAPTSRMDSQNVFLDSTTFVVAWHGSDDSLGSGIASFDLYQSVNHSPFELVESGLKDTVYTISGGWYNDYSYFSIAKDNVGNVEPMKLVGELTVDLTNPPTVLSVDSLTIKIATNGNERSADLYWPRAIPDSTADSTTQIGYWIYTRADVSGGSFGWYFLASTVDTFYSYQVPAQSDELVRMFLVAAYQTTAQSGTATPPQRPPSILLQQEFEVPQSVTPLAPQSKSDAAHKTVKAKPLNGTVLKKDVTRGAK